MNGFLPLLSLLLIFSWLGQAAPSSCASGDLEDYIGLGPDGCTIGSGRFFGFELLDPLNGATEIPLADIAVVPLGGASNPGLRFLVNTAAVSGQILEARIGYTLAPYLSGPIEFARLTMAGSSATGDGAATVSEEFCLGSSFTSGVCTVSTDNLIVFDIGSLSSLSEGLDLPPLTRLGVVKDIVVDGGPSGSAAIGSVTNQFTTVPEPGTVITVSIALAALVGLRRRFEKKRRVL